MILEQCLSGCVSSFKAFGSLSREFYAIYASNADKIVRANTRAILGIHYSIALTLGNFKFVHEFICTVPILAEALQTLLLFESTSLQQ